MARLCILIVVLVACLGCGSAAQNYGHDAAQGAAATLAAPTTQRTIAHTSANAAAAARNVVLSPKTGKKLAATLQEPLAEVKAGLDAEATVYRNVAIGIAGASALLLLALALVIHELRAHRKLLAETFAGVNRPTLRTVEHDE